MASKTTPGQLSVVSFDEEKGLFLEPNNKFIVYQVSQGVIAALGVFKSEKIIALSEAEKRTAISMGLVLIETTKPKVYLKIGTEIGMSSLDEEKGWYHIIENDIVVRHDEDPLGDTLTALGMFRKGYKVSEGDGITTFPIFKAWEIIPLTPEQIKWVHTEGLLVESERDKETKRTLELETIYLRVSVSEKAHLYLVNANNLVIHSENLIEGPHTVIGVYEESVIRPLTSVSKQLAISMGLEVDDSKIKDVKEVITPSKVSLEVVEHTYTIPFDKKRGLYRVPMNDIILRLDKIYGKTVPTAIGVFKIGERIYDGTGIYGPDTVIPLSEKQIEWARAHGARIESDEIVEPTPEPDSDLDPDPERKIITVKIHDKDAHLYQTYKDDLIIHSENLKDGPHTVVGIWEYNMVRPIPPVSRQIAQSMGLQVDDSKVRNPPTSGGCTDETCEHCHPSDSEEQV